MRIQYGPLLFALLVAYGCSEDASTPAQDDANAPVEGARLSRAEVLKMADGFAEQKRYERFELKFYPDRSATFDAEAKVWWVHYEREPNRWPGGHFSVLVDDATGEMEYFGGE